MLTVTAAIIVQQGRILAAQRSENMQHPLKWEFPGGKMEEGESAEECIVREIQEELEVSIRITGTAPKVRYPSEDPRIELLPFTAVIAAGSPKAVEHAQIAWVKPQELAQLDWAEADLDIVKWCMENENQLLGHGK